jgi:hypothetical protein
MTTTRRSTIKLGFSSHLSFGMNTSFDSMVRRFASGSFFERSLNLGVFLFIYFSVLFFCFCDDNGQSDTTDTNSMTCSSQTSKSSIQT